MTTAILAIGLSLGCGEQPQDRPFVDAAPRPDAPECAPGSAIIGRCELATGGVCTGVPDEPQVFVGLASGDSVPIVVGPQGAEMLVLGIQTSGIYPGRADDPASTDNPTVSIALRDGGSDVAHYRGRHYFEASEPEPMLVVPGLFVIVEGAGELDGRRLTAVAEVLDRDDLRRCGTIELTATR